MQSTSFSWKVSLPSKGTVALLSNPLARPTGLSQPDIPAEKVLRGATELGRSSRGTEQDRDLVACPPWSLLDAPGKLCLGSRCCQNWSGSRAPDRSFPAVRSRPRFHQHTPHLCPWRSSAPPRRQAAASSLLAVDSCAPCCRSSLSQEGAPSPVAGRRFPEDLSPVPAFKGLGS